SKIISKQYRRNQSVVCSDSKMISMIKNKKTRLADAPFRLRFVSSLELEANGQLHLTLAEQSAVRAGDLLERRVESQTLQAAPRRTTSGGKSIDGRIHIGDLR